MKQIFATLTAFGIFVSLGLSGSASADTPSAATLKDQFKAAAQEFAVPETILEGIAYVESGWQSLDAKQASGDDHGRSGVYGVMALKDSASPFGIAAAAALIGQKPEALKTSSLQNIRGAAALLAKLASAENLAANGSELNSSNLQGWVKIVAKFSNLEVFKRDEETGKLIHNDVEEDRQRASYAEGVLKQIARGYVVDGIAISAIALDGSALAASVAAVSGELRARIDFLTPLEGILAKMGKVVGSDFPGAKYKQSPFSKVGGPAKKYIVIHSTEGAYAGAVNWLTSPANPLHSSAHYVIRSVDGEITQLVKNADRANHACGRNRSGERWNDMSIGIEHEGWAAKTGWQTPELYQASAKLVAFLMKTFSIPISNVISHAEAYQIHREANAGCNFRTDPGANWDWTSYRSLVEWFINPATVI